MGLFSRLLGQHIDVIDEIVHDYTVGSGTRRITLVKPLDKAGKVFLSGLGQNVNVGDIVVVKGRDMAGTHMRYRINSLKRTPDEWRAYAQQEQSNLPLPLPRKRLKSVS
jgi:hypothetical protein